MIRGREMTGGKHAAIESALHKDAAVVDRYDAAQMATVDSERGKQWSRRCSDIPYQRRSESRRENGPRIGVLGPFR